MVGNRYGRLVVLRRSGTDKWRQSIMECQCDCGSIAQIIQGSLKTGRSLSCGCLQREKLSERNYKHGQSFTPEYRTWAGVKNRCTNPKSEHWDCYGGRGITMSQEWMDSFEVFLSDMGVKPFLKAEIDRINNEFGYFAGNCRWTDKITNLGNKRNSVFITYNGETKNVSQWEKEKRVSPGLFKNRKRAGWSDTETIEGKTKKH